MGLAAEKPSQVDRAPFSRAPSSGVRPRVQPRDAANDSTLDESIVDHVEPAVLVRGPVGSSPDVDGDELHLEDAVPLKTDAALAVVLGFVMVAASGLVVAFNVL